MSKEMVIHPKHYNTEGRKECWDEMIEIFSDEEMPTTDGIESTIIFDVMSAYKYWYRAGNKDGNPEEQDKAKIDNYFNHAKSLLLMTPAYCLARKLYSVVWDKIYGEDYE